MFKQNAQFLAQNIVLFSLSLLLTTTPSWADHVCAPNNVTLCGSSIPVDVETLVGQKTEIEVPPSTLADPDSSQRMTFTAACVYDAQGNPSYQVEDQSQVLCNAFPCPTTSFNICGTSIPVEGGAAVGMIIDMQMPLPFSPDPFKVECVANLNGMPVYRLKEKSAVTCGTMPATE